MRCCVDYYPEFQKKFKFQKLAAKKIKLGFFYENKEITISLLKIEILIKL